MSDFFTNLVGWLTSALSWLADAVVMGIKAALFWPFDGLLTVIQLFFTSLDLSAFTASYAMNWAGLPPQLIYCINAVGIVQCIGLLCTAIIIRMVINLIPAAFTRI
jgi:hypothetical protein